MANNGAILDPDVETRPRTEQARIDDATYRDQIALPVRALRLLSREAARGRVRGCRRGRRLGPNRRAAVHREGRDPPQPGPAPAVRQPPRRRPGQHRAHLSPPPARPATPCYMPVTAADLSMWIEISSRSYFAGGLRPGMRVISTYNAGPFVAGAALDTMTNLGVCHIPVGTGNTARLHAGAAADQAGRLALHAVLCRLPRRAPAEHGIAPASFGVRRICVAGEPGGGEADLRSRLEERLDAKLCEAMGIGDISDLALGRMRGAGRDAFQRRRLRACRADRSRDGRDRCRWRTGRQGELVYTALQREAVPLLRFRSRDHVVCRRSPCRCGRTTMRVRCIGRTDDLLIVRGVNLFPSAVRSVVAKFAPQVSGAILMQPDHGAASGRSRRCPCWSNSRPTHQSDEALAEAIAAAVRDSLSRRSGSSWCRSTALSAANTKPSCSTSPTRD